MTQGPGHSISADDGLIILRLQLLIARAANKDSLAWWDDESLTPHAGFVLERLFPITPNLAARSLALAAAQARHRAAYAGLSGALHLYHLDADSQDALVLRNLSPMAVSVPQEAMTSVDDLRQHLLDVFSEPPSYTVVRRTEGQGLQIQLSQAPTGCSLLLHRAQILAWAYLEGKPGQPVFPFFVENH